MGPSFNQGVLQVRVPRSPFLMSLLSLPALKFPPSPSFCSYFPCSHYQYQEIKLPMFYYTLSPTTASAPWEQNTSHLIQCPAPEPTWLTWHIVSSMNADYMEAERDLPMRWLTPLLGSSIEGLHSRQSSGGPKVNNRCPAHALLARTAVHWTCWFCVLPLSSRNLPQTKGHPRIAKR